MKEYIKKIKCLGDETRIRILKTLIASGKELCVCEIVDSLQIPFYTVSKHIKELKNAGLVMERKEGKFILYSLSSFDRDKFSRIIIDLVKAVPGVFFKDDKKQLEKRLSLRKSGKCVVGLNEGSCRQGIK